MPILRDHPRAARIILFAALIVVLVLAGFVLGWRLAPESTTNTAIGRVSFSVHPSLRGEASAVIPVADWGFRADAFDGPIELRAELRSLDRSALTRAADGDLSVLRTTEDELESGARAAVLRAFGWGAGCALVLLIVATLIWRGLQPRWALLATGAGVGIVLGTLSLLLVRSSFDAAAFERPTYFANGAELQRILEVAEDERATSTYGSTFGSILRSVSTVLAGAPGPAAPGRDIFLGSDLHANALVVQPLAETIGDEPFILAGDFGQRGGAAEARLLAPRVAALGSNVIATSGNHDTASLMDALAGQGVEVLGEGETGAPESTDVDGLRITGFPDPLEWNGKGDPNSRPVTFDDLPDPESARETAVAALLDGFEDLTPAPDVVVVHQSGLAHALAEDLYEREYGRDLLILTGHDHRQRLERYGSVVVVNGGSIGAGGIFDAGRQPIGLAELHFEPDAAVLLSVDLILIEPFSGEAQASRIVLDAFCPDEERCSFEPPGLGESLLEETDENGDA